MWLTGLVAPRHVGSSQIRARTRVPCIGRQILNHCATREALHYIFDILLVHQYVTTGFKKEINIHVHQETYVRMSIAAYVNQLDYGGDMYMKYIYHNDMYMKTSSSIP